MSASMEESNAVSGEFIDLHNERYYAIRNVDKMPAFFVSVISDSDHWLFISSTGGLTAGRVSPNTPLFPYVTVDKIHESTEHTGSKTLVRAEVDGTLHEWEPYNREHDGLYNTTRNLYKNLLGNKLCFEEINHDLQVAFRYCWVTADTYGFARQCELENLSDKAANLELLDGFQNIMPAGTPRFAQTNSSVLVDAYKWSELDEQTGLGMFTLYSAITDRAEPAESLKAATVFCLGLDSPKVLLSSLQIDNFRRGESLEQEAHKRGIRAAYMVNTSIELAPGATKAWQLVAEVEQSQGQVVSLRNRIARDPEAVSSEIDESVANGSDELARIMAGGDGFQVTAEENVSVHHYANVLFNILRGGTFDNQYQVSAQDFSGTIQMFNGDVYERHQELLSGLADHLDYNDLLAIIKAAGDPQLERLTYEYLPITFGRRHGDPSRPWNEFAIKLKDDQGNRLLSYQGNWRDIFQNWEALTFSYPEFIENVIAKFVNASTVDGYNPYRITKEGIDWEEEDPDDPWSYIGYWGDHQIIYLLKLLEQSNKFHPERLSELLREPIFSYANVPYRIKPFEALVEDAKNTVEYDTALEHRIEERVAIMGADGKLLRAGDGSVYQVNLLEKLLVPLLSKLGNLVLDGGIWLNTQRPEWNDANNALVGAGISMVTLYYMRRYISFVQNLLAEESGSFTLSREVHQWLVDTAATLARVAPSLGAEPVSAEQRYEVLVELGEIAGRYRQTVYAQEAFGGTVEQDLDQVSALLNDAMTAIDHSIQTNQREDGLYHAYNLLDLDSDKAEVETLYAMLEGQVSALSSGAIPPAQAVEVLDALFASNVYRDDQHTFMLYPDRKLPDFLAKNQVPGASVESIPLLQRMLADGDQRIIMQDDDGCYRFNGDFGNVGDLNDRLDSLSGVYGDEIDAARQPLRDLYEEVFNHKAFTGRSGGMFGFEGLGSIYWHMVSKLLLAVEENFSTAIEQGADADTISRLGELYYRVRYGIGFNKTPAEYGAFPYDPYSHTPKHAGAQQPGMTGQVKEEVLSRFAELGLMVSGGTVTFEPRLLRQQEFVAQPGTFRYLDVDDQWQELDVPAAGLAFTWCQVPITYRLDDAAEPGITITRNDGSEQAIAGLALSAADSEEIFRRSGNVRKLELVFGPGLLLAS